MHCNIDFFYTANSVEMVKLGISLPRIPRGTVDPIRMILMDPNLNYYHADCLFKGSLNALSDEEILSIVICPLHHLFTRYVFFNGCLC